jgi:dihydroorotate dehydrogenase electron transfer subunit
VKKNVNETSSVKTVRLDGMLDTVPGQFVMVWVPGIDEFPMSVSYPGRDFGITYQILGEGTKALGSMMPGHRVGVRGPYGNGFSVDIAASKKVSVDLVLGARSDKELVFEKRASRAGARVHISTDDGSKGFKGFASDLALELLESERYDHLYACGPEKMIAKLVVIASKRKMPMQASLERYMKCGIGICDSCALDGVHVCKEGPVFSLNDLRKFGDLGRAKLDPAGRKVPV